MALRSKVNLRRSSLSAMDAPPQWLSWRTASTKCTSGRATDCDQAQETTGGDTTMRGFLLAILVAAGLGLAGTSGVSAAPVNGAVIGDAATASDHVTQVRWGH